MTRAEETVVGNTYAYVPLGGHVKELVMALHANARRWCQNILG